MIKAYLDTSILMGWVIYRDMPWQRIKQLEIKIQSTRRLYDLLINNKLNCRFVTSYWALAELANVLRNYAIGAKMLRDGRNLSYFNRYKEKYQLSRKELREVRNYFLDMWDTLKDFGIEIREVKITRKMPNKIALSNVLSPNDAIHIFCALPDCDYLITLDSDFKKVRFKKPKAVYPQEFLNIKGIIIR